MKIEDIDKKTLLKIITKMGALGGDDDDRLGGVAHRVTGSFVRSGKITPQEQKVIHEFLGVEHEDTNTRSRSSR